MAICFVQIVIICVGTLADTHASSSLAAMSHIKWLTDFFTAWKWRDRTLLLLCMLLHELLVT